MRSSRTAICIAALLALAPAVMGQAVAGDPNNAATWYRQATARYRAMEYQIDKWERIWSFEGDPDRGPSDEARRHMQRHLPIIELIARGGRRS